MATMKNKPSSIKSSAPHGQSNKFIYTQDLLTKNLKRQDKNIKEHRLAEISIRQLR